MSIAADAIGGVTSDGSAPVKAAHAKFDLTLPLNAIKGTDAVMNIEELPTFRGSEQADHLPLLSEITTPDRRQSKVKTNCLSKRSPKHLSLESTQSRPHQVILQQRRLSK